MPNNDKAGNPIFAKNITSQSGSGCLRALGSSTAKVNLLSDPDFGMATAFDFDASRSSSLYSGSTMQSKALQTLACIRV